MSATTKKKYVTQEALDDYPEPTPEQTIVRVLGARGNNLHEVEWPDGTRALASMPTKFRMTVWIKRGDHIIIEPIDEGDKVQAEIAHVLLPPQIRHLKKKSLWPVFVQDSLSGAQASAEPAEPAEPAAPDATAVVITGSTGGDANALAEAAEGDGEYESESEDDMSDLMANMNHRTFAAEEEDTESDDEDS